MVGFRSCIFFSLGLLSTLLLATPALAEEHGPQVCGKNEEHDSAGQCCKKDLMDEEEGLKKCWKEPTDITVAVAFTLIGSFTFLISLNFAMHWPDEDMKRYAYKVISNTVSIFCAVMMFQCIDGLVEEWIIEPNHLEHYFIFAVDFAHMMCWYVITQFVIAAASGVLKSEDAKKLLEEDVKRDVVKKEKVEKEKELIQIRCSCYGGVVAHLTGFAAINSWTSLQQQSPYNQNPLMALVPLVLSTVLQTIIQWITARCRHIISMSDDDRKDWYEKRWEVVCREAEDDVMGLTSSVIVVNALRMAINSMVPAGAKCLPNEEQKEEGPTCEGLEEERTQPQVLYLFLIGFGFVIVLFMTKLTYEKLSKGEKGEHNAIEEEDDESNKSYCHQIIERGTETMMISLSMAYAWCMFHANRQLLAVIGPGILGGEDGALTLAVVLALEITYIAWIMIYFLDYLIDLPDEYTSDVVDDSIKVVIDAMSLFIGFAWEQTFDASVSNLADSFRKPFGKGAPAVAKFIIGTLCCGIVFIAWKWYILPFVVKEGWRFNLVFTSSDLHRVAHQVAKLDPEFKETILPHFKKMYGALGDDVPHSRALKRANTRERLRLEKGSMGTASAPASSFRGFKRGSTLPCSGYKKLLGEPASAGDGHLDNGWSSKTDWGESGRGETNRGRGCSELEEKNRTIVEERNRYLEKRLKQVESDNVKLQELLNHYMQNMLGSLKELAGENAQRPMHVHHNSS